MNDRQSYYFRLKMIFLTCWDECSMKTNIMSFFDLDFLMEQG